MPHQSTKNGKAAPEGAEDWDALFDDPLVQAHIERAVAPYRRHLPPKALEMFRQTLLAVLTTHPEVAPVMERLRRAKAQKRSGTRAARGGGPN